jgi:hypothetical protein
MRKTILTSFLSLFAFSLSFAHIDDGKIECIDFYYIDSGIHYTISLSCNSLMLVNPHHIKIENTEFLVEFETELRKLSKIESSEIIDSRIRAVIFYTKSSKSDTLCLSEFQGISLNFERINNSPKLLNLIANRIDYFKKKYH